MITIVPVKLFWLFPSSYIYGLLLPSACSTSSRVAVCSHGFPLLLVCCILFSQPLLCQVFLHAVHPSPLWSSSSSPSFYLHLESCPHHMVLLPSNYMAIPPQPLLLDLSVHLCDFTLSLITLFSIWSSQVCPHAHFNIFISPTVILFSLVFLIFHVSAL